MVKVFVLLIWGLVINLSMYAMDDNRRYVLEKIIQTQFTYERIGFIKEYASGLLIYGTNLGVGIIQEIKQKKVVDRLLKYEEIEQEKQKKIQKNEGIVSLWNAEKKGPLIALEAQFDLDTISEENRWYVMVCPWWTKKEVHDQRLKKVYSFHQTENEMLYCGHNDGIISVWQKKHRGY